MSPPPPKTNAVLAKRHCVSVRTIQRWRAAGAPFNNERQLAVWVARHTRTRSNDSEIPDLRVSASEIDRLIAQGNK